MNLRPADTKSTSPNRGVTGREITGRHVLIALLLFFGAVTAVNIFMIRAAVSTFGGVETRSSYRAGLGFADEQARVAEQDARGWNVSADIAGTVDDRSILVRVQDRIEAPIGDLAARAVFAHPVDSRRDLELDLVETAVGTYAADFTLPAGSWVLKLEFTRDRETLFRSQNRHRLL